MAIGFLAQPPRKGMFGSRGIMPGDQTMPQQPMGPLDTYQRIDAISGPSEAPAKKPGFFGQGGVGRSIAGSIGDYLLQSHGGSAVYGPAMQAERDRATKESDYQRQRMDHRDDWMWQQDYERAHPKPGSAYRTEDNAGNVWEQDPITGQFKTIFTDPNDKVYMQDGQMITVPNRVRSQSAAPQPGTVVTDPRLGGGASGSSAGGGFPRR